MNVKNSVLKPILFTLLAMLFLLVAAFSIMHFFFPLNVSNWMYRMGANEAATYYMERSYEKTEDYNQLYSLLNLSIKTKDWERVEKYYEVFSENENYTTFTLRVDASNLTKNNSNLVKSTLYSEDNYLKNRYVLALTSQGKTEKAINFVVLNTDFSFTTEELGIYTGTYLFTEGVNLNNLSNLEDYSVKLVEYFNKNIEMFNQVVNSSQPQKVIGLVLGTRINEIARNLKVIKQYNENLIMLTNEEINNMVLQVSQTMPQLV